MQVIVTCLVEPGYFREIHSFVQHSSDGQGRLEVVSLAAIDETDTGAAFEMSTPQPLQATPSATAGAAATNGSDGATDGSNAGLEASTASRCALHTPVDIANTCRKVQVLCYSCCLHCDYGAAMSLRVFWVIIAYCKSAPGTAVSWLLMWQRLARCASFSLRPVKASPRHCQAKAGSMEGEFIHCA